MYKNKYLKYKNKYLALQQQFRGGSAAAGSAGEGGGGGAKVSIRKLREYGSEPKPHICTINELMSQPDYETNCTNITMVTGSCAYPSFRYGVGDITVVQKDQYVNIFTLIRQKDIEYLDIIIGATNNLSSDFKDLDKSLQLLIDPSATNYNDYDKIIEDITDNKRKLFFKSDFPLNYTLNSKIVLDLLIDINKTIKVRITNRMCGTCHRSLYYLVNNDIEYIVNPEQGLAKEDTPEIRTCFKDAEYALNQTRKTMYLNDKQVYPPPLNF